MMMIQTHGNHKKSTNKTFLPYVQNTRMSGRSHSMAHNMNNQSQIVKEPILKQYKQLTYFLGKGNNENVVRKVMEKRTNWMESEDSTSAFINMKWQQDQKGYRYNRLVESGQYRGIVNHFEFHEYLSNKEFLFRSLEKYCTKNGVDLWKIVPPTYILNSRDQCCMQNLKQFIDFYQKHYPRSLKQRSTADVQKQIMDQRRKLRTYFFNSNLKKILPKNPPMLSVYVNKEQGDYLWIVKPTFLNRGRGIQVFSGLNELSKYVSQNIEGYVEKKLGDNESQIKVKKTNVDYVQKNYEMVKSPIIQRQQQMQQQQQWRQKRQEYENESVFDGNQFIRIIPGGPAVIKTDCFLIQKYLQRPFLILNRKFDIRVWVLVNHIMKVYVFPEGYVRLSSQQYTSRESSNSFVHLTNNSVQKYSQEYGKVAEGNQLSFEELKKIMQENSLDFDECRNTMYDHIKISMNSTIKKLNQYNRKFVFQIFGYDFMIDETGHPWLIEVNTNPSLEESSKLLCKLIPRMLDDAFKLSIDNLFYGSHSSGDYPVDGYGKGNMWINLKLDDK